MYAATVMAPYLQAVGAAAARQLQVVPSPLVAAATLCTSSTVATSHKAPAHNTPQPPPGAAGVAGIGVDICHIPRIARVLERYGTRFTDKMLAPGEAAALAALPPPRRATFVASRWAAKEALHKALRAPRLLFPDMEVRPAPTTGAPTFQLHGAAAAHFTARALHPFLSLSHDGEYAIAFVTLVGSASPTGTSTPAP